MLLSIGSWLLSHVLRLASSDMLTKAVNLATKFTDNANQAKVAAIDGVTKLAATNADVEKAKFQFPFFWIFAALLLGPVIISFWAVGLYNIFFWEHGMFPQPWAIAAWPGVYQDWATSAFNFVFAPALGLGVILKLLK